MYNFLNFLATFWFSPLSWFLEPTGSEKRRNPAKIGLWKAVQPKPEVEFGRKRGEWTQRPRFPLRVPIHYWAYLLQFRIYPPRNLTLRHCKDDGKLENCQTWVKLFDALVSTRSLLSYASKKCILSHETFSLGGAKHGRFSFTGIFEAQFLEQF